MIVHYAARDKLKDVEVKKEKTKSVGAEPVSYTHLDVYKRQS